MSYMLQSGMQWASCCSSELFLEVHSSEWHARNILMSYLVSCILQSGIWWASCGVVDRSRSSSQVVKG